MHGLNWLSERSFFTKKRQTDELAAEAAKALEAKRQAQVLEKRLWQSSAHHFYPVRPIFTLLTGLFFVGLALLIPEAAHVFIFLGVLIMLDDMVIYPWLHFQKYQVNIHHNHKRLRSVIGSVFIAGSLISGLLIGYFVLTTIPQVMSAISEIVSAADGSVFILVLCTVGFSVLSKWLGYPQLLGIGIGATIATAIQIHLPLIIDVTMMTGIIAAFVGAVLIKKILQASMWLHSKALLGKGSTNADGYEHTWWEKQPLIASEQIEKEQERGIIEGETKLELRAKQLKVGIDEYQALVDALIVARAEVKKTCNWWHDFSGGRELMTAPFKDIYFLLMRVSEHPHTPDSEDTQKDVVFLFLCIQQLLNKENPVNTISYFGAPFGVTLKKICFIFSDFRGYWSDPDPRVGFRQYWANLGLKVTRDQRCRFENNFILFLRGFESGLTKMTVTTKENLKKAVDAYVSNYFSASIPLPMVIQLSTADIDYLNSGYISQSIPLPRRVEMDYNNWIELYLNQHCPALKSNLLKALALRQGQSFSSIANFSEFPEIDNPKEVSELNDDVADPKKAFARWESAPTPSSKSVELPDKLHTSSCV